MPNKNEGRVALPAEPMTEEVILDTLLNSQDEAEDYNLISSIAREDVKVLRKKGQSYGGSWKKRGGVGAFMMLARKWDRIELACEESGYDIFDVIKGQADAPDSILDDIRDLRAYLLLVEAECHGK